MAQEKMAAPDRVEGIRRSGMVFDLDIAGGGLVRLELLSSCVLRVRRSSDGAFPVQATMLHGFARDHLDAGTDACAEAEVRVTEDRDTIAIRSPGLGVLVNRSPLRLSFLAADGTVLTRGATPSRSPWGTGVSMSGGPQPAICMSMDGEEHFHGLGFHRGSVDCRGKTLEWTRMFRHHGATVPFFMSSRGYAFLSNNPWRHVFDFSTVEGSADGLYTITADGGLLDFFIIQGESFRDLLRRYGDLTGRPQLPPRYALGLLYICRYFEPQEGVLAIADSFRAHDIPCDMIGLEPGWEDVPYAMEWRWSPERFPDPAGMIRALRDRGFVLELWESGDAPRTGYADPEVRKQWYAKRIAGSIDLGVGFFKQDDPYPRMIASQELQAPELGEPLGDSGGASSAEYRNITNSLYSETALSEHRRLTGKRTMAIFNGYTVSVGSHRWPAAWAADYAAGAGLLNASLSGHSMVCMDMRNSTPAGIHLGFLIPFSIIDAWAYYNEPWLFPPHILDCHRHYAKLRHSLTPYLYSTLRQSNGSCLPALRPMVLDHQTEAFSRELTTQHMLGDWLLVGHERSVYLPRGRWIDYWTGDQYPSDGRWITCDVEEPAGGPLFVKAGGIIPTKPVAPFIAAEPDELVILALYPGDESSSYTLYEDDGSSYAYEEGAFATTEISSRSARRELRVRIGSRQGAYDGMPAARTYLLRIQLERGEAEPDRVTAGGEPLSRKASRQSLLHTRDEAGFWYDAASALLWVKPEPGWKLGPDARGADRDPEKDTMVWTRPERPDARALEVAIRRAQAVSTHPERRAARRAEKPSSPDCLHVAALPPERVALRHGDWLPMRTGFWVTLMTGSRPASGAEATIRMEVLDRDGRTLRTEVESTQKGRVRFGNMEYVPGEWTFRFSSPGLPAVDVVIRPAPPVPGKMA